MSSLMFQTLGLLDKNKVYYTIQRTRSETIQINAHFVGTRLEIEVFEDDHIEMSRFVGNEDVESGGLEMILDLIKELS